MPIVPAINIQKSIVTNTPYSPAVSFNPDKKLFYDTHGTTLGVLSGGVITSDGVDITVPAGTAFIQNGIIVTLTSNFVVNIPGIGFPKYIVADNVNENAGTAVTIEILAAILPPQVLLGTLNPNNTTIVLPPQVSIRALREDIDALSAGAIDVEQDNVAVKSNVETLNAIGPNVTITDPGGVQADIGVKLDVKEAGVPKTVRTEEINFIGNVTVTAATANKADVNILPNTLVVKDEGITQSPNKDKLNFTGTGVTVTTDGGDTAQANVNIQGVEGFLEGGIIDGIVDGSGGAREFLITGLVINRDGVRSGPITTTVSIAANGSGSPRTDMLQWNGTTLSIKMGTPGPTAPCPTPDPGNIPISVALVPPAAPNLLRGMNKQSTIAEAVIVAHYYSNGGLHASRVGVTANPSIGTTTYKDAEEMTLSVYFPRSGYRYELAWDVVIAQALYGFLNEGAHINMSFDGADEDELVHRRSYMHTNITGGVSIHGFEVTVAMFYNRFSLLGPHTLIGRIKQNTLATPETMSEKRRRIWIHEIQ